MAKVTEKAMVLVLLFSVHMVDLCSRLGSVRASRYETEVWLRQLK